MDRDFVSAALAPRGGNKEITLPSVGSDCSSQQTQDYLHRLTSCLKDLAKAHHKHTNVIDPNPEREPSEAETT